MRLEPIGSIQFVESYLILKYYKSYNYYYRILSVISDGAKKGKEFRFFYIDESCVLLNFVCE